MLFDNPNDRQNQNDRQKGISGDHIVDHLLNIMLLSSNGIWITQLLTSTETSGRLKSNLVSLIHIGNCVVERVQGIVKTPFKNEPS